MRGTKSGYVVLFSSIVTIVDGQIYGGVWMEHSPIPYSPLMSFQSPQPGREIVCDQDPLEQEGAGAWEEAEGAHGRDLDWNRPVLTMLPLTAAAVQQTFCRVFGT